jgi:putative NAD(P)-binding protein
VTHPELAVTAGQLTNREGVQRAVTGADAVISALGPSLDRKATAMPLIDGTRTIVDAMQAADVARYIAMATPSLRDPHDEGTLVGHVVPFMGRTFLKRAYRELLEMSQIVTDSSLNGDLARHRRSCGRASRECEMAAALDREHGQRARIWSVPVEMRRPRAAGATIRSAFRPEQFPSW